MSDAAVKIAVRARYVDVVDETENFAIFSPQSKQIITRDDNKIFNYDFVFDGSATQEEIFENVAVPVLEKFLLGYNGSIIAYGQTGSGKTYTMGTESLDENCDENKNGIIPRIIHELFEKIDGKDVQNINVSFIEVYMDAVYDLLHEKRGRQPLSVREDYHGIKLFDLSEKVVDCYEDALSCLRWGIEGRKTTSTSLNVKSSRSHAIFTIEMEQKIGDKIYKPKLQFVDLAGSEPVHKIADPVTKAEGININRNLLSLGNVIEALNKEKIRSNKQSFIPYRSCTLTRLLQDSLGGNTYTIMIACVCPVTRYSQETISTLRYAERARGIFKKPISSSFTPWKSSAKKPTNHTPRFTPYSAKKKSPRLNNSTKLDSSSIPESNSELETTKLNDLVNDLPPSIDYSPFLNKMTAKFEKHFFSTPMVDKLASRLKNNGILKPGTTIPENLEIPFIDQIVSSAPNISPDVTIDQSFAVPEPPTVRRSLRLNKFNVENATTKSNMAAVCVTQNLTLPSVVTTPRGTHRYRTMLVPDSCLERSRINMTRNKENVELSYDMLASPEFMSTTKFDSTQNGFKILPSPRRGWKLGLNESVKSKINREVLKILNTGTQTELQRLPAIGPKMAQIIFNFRQVYGPLKDISDMQIIEGLPKTFYKRFARANLVNHVDI